MKTAILQYTTNESRCYLLLVSGAGERRNMEAVEIKDGIMKDCIFYREKKTISEDSTHQVKEVTKGKECSALKALYCAYSSTKRCGFYKSNTEYNPDGTRKESRK